MNVQESMLEKVKASVLAMPIARTLRLSFIRIEPGLTELQLPIQEELCFQPGQLQATAVFAVADFAAVSAAATLLPHGSVNATVDATIKLLAPAKGSHLVARGRVVNASSRLTVCAAEVFAVDNGEERLCATLLGTAYNVIRSVPS